MRDWNSRGWRAAALMAWIAVLGPAACQRRAPDPGPDPFAPKQGEEDLPFTEDCRSWEELDPSSLPSLPESPFTATFEHVWLKVGQQHYDPTLGCLDWPALRERYGKKVAAAKDVGEAYALINELLGTLRQSHLRAVPPAGASSLSTDAGPWGPAIVPLRLRLIGDEVVVMADLRRAPATSPDPEGADPEAPSEAAAAIAPGAVLVAVEKARVADAVAEGRRQAERPAEQTLLATRQVESLLHCPRGATKKISFRAPGGDEVRDAVVACELPEGERITLGNLRDLPTRVDARVLGQVGELDGSKVGYLAFNYWMVPMVPRIRAELARLREAGIDRLVLDLRGNPGGVGAMAIPVARMLLREGGELGRLSLRDSTLEFDITASAEAFDGPVVVLIDEGTASTSEIFTAGLRDLGRIEVVGASSSAGLALPSVMETLPDGGLLQYVVGDYRSSRGTVPEGEGIAPDELVPVTRAELAQGRDPVLEAGLRRVLGLPAQPAMPDQAPAEVPDEGPGEASGEAGGDADG